MTADLDRLPELPPVPIGATIPKTIYQTYPSKTLPDAFAANVAFLKRLNPAWRHVLMDDADVARFVRDEYGPDILARLDSIDPTYGAARADLFRYLLIYRRGGVYLDIKSRFARPIDEVLDPDEAFLISQWGENRPGERYAGYGLHPELAALPGGEYQQWQICAVAGHPYLREVIGDVLDNLRRYRPWRDGVGAPAVLRLTGPVAYTLAIRRVRDRGPSRIVRDVDVGLDYNGVGGDFRSLFRSHYLVKTEPVVTQTGIVRLAYAGIGAAKRLKRRIAAARR